MPSTTVSCGIYHVEVKSNEERFNKIFSDNYYIHFSLNFIMNVYNMHHNGNFNLTLLSNKCLKYKDKTKIIKSSKVFSQWYWEVRELQVGKHLLASTFNLLI